MSVEDRPRREVAYRTFAAEFEDATLSHSESDEERAPNYVVTPTGARINRLFVVGVLTEIEEVGSEQLRARIADPTGGFVSYAGQYQPDALATLDGLTPPAFVAVTGKARTFEPEDSDRVYTSIRPESIGTVDAAVRDRWTVTTAERTLERVRTAIDAHARDERGEELRAALSAAGVPEGLAAGIPLAFAHYGTTPAYLGAVGDLALDTARVVAGEREEVAPLDVAPDQTGDAPPSTARFDSVGSSAVAVSATDASGASESTDAGESRGDESESTPDDGVSTEAGSTPETGESTAETTGNVAEGSSDGPDETETAEEFDLDREEREHLEAEYGTEFERGSEVDDPGEADIETPEPPDSAASPEPQTDATDEPDTESADATAKTDAVEPGVTEHTETDVTGDAEATGDAGADAKPADESEPTPESEPTLDDEPETVDGSDTENGPETTDDSDTDVDLDDAVMDAMETHDEGDGADREAVIESVTTEYGVDSAAVEDAIQTALLDGRCYEPDDDTLTPI